MSASRLRTISQVWPPWLPGALTGAEHQLPSTAASTPLPALLFSASFKALSPPLTTPESQSRPNRRFRAATSISHRPTIQSAPQYQHTTIQSAPQYQQIRASSSNSTSHRRQFTTTPHSPPEVHTEHAAAKPEAWQPPADIEQRPVCILGSGVLGRRLAVVWASTSRPVTVYDTSPAALSSSRTYIADSLAAYCAEHNTHPGHVRFSGKLEDAVRDAWMVIEAVPEDLELKVSLLGRVDRLVGKDVLIATNSAGFSSKNLVSEVHHRERVLNTLYYIPPRNKCVEMMSCGYTSPSIIPFMVEQMESMGLRPIVIPDGSSKGMIFPRIWGAMKKETLKVLSEGVADPDEVDILFKDFFGAQRGPCEMMDEVGLDSVVKSERNRLPSLREGDGFWGTRGEAYVEWLEKEFVRKGKLGAKSGEGLIVKKIKSKKTEKDTSGQEVWKEHSVDLSGL